MKRITLLVLLVGWLCCHFSGCTSISDYNLQTRFAEFFSQVRPAREDPEAHYQLATYYQQQGKHGYAIEEFQKVVDICPDHVGAYNGMGISYDMLEDFQRAIQSFEHALKLNPSSGHTYNNLGYSFMMQGKIEDAIAALQKAVAIEGAIKCFHNNLGAAYAMASRHDLAFGEFEKGGDKSQANKNIAMMLLRQGLFLDAGTHSLKDFSFNPPDDQLRSEITLCDGQIQKSHEPEGAKFLIGTDAAIELSNGNGVNNMAKNIKEYLAERGYNVVRLTNADHFHHASGRIYYSEAGLETAKRLAAEMPGKWISLPVEGLEKPKLKVKVLIGRDLIPYRNDLKES